MKEFWTEEDVRRLASEESNDFDRKSGRLLEKEANQFYNDLAKALSAFANSGGGSIVLGVEDDGTFTGLEQMRGSTTTKDWLEQKLPILLSYPLSLFRVHTVIADENSKIAVGKILVVIEIGDSPAAPHQSNRDKKYYYRSAGRSEPASHFYLELLRQRLTNPILEFTFNSFNIIHAQEFENALFIEAILRLEIKNIGNVAAYKWEARPMHLRLETDLDVNNHIFVHRQNFPLKRSIGIGIPIDKTVLPGLNITDDIYLAFSLPKSLTNLTLLEQEIEDIIRALTIGIKLATETSQGEIIELKLSDHIITNKVSEQILKRLNS